MGHDPSPYVIVGMMCCFGSISRAPLAVMLMVA
jgi:CIC family chloride channel protein